MDGSAYEDFLTCNVGTLKDFLHLRGLAVTGTKVELVARAFAACELKLPLVISQEEQSKCLQTEYQRRLSEFDLPDPKSFKEEDWVDSVYKWPSLDLGKLFSYILSQKEFDSEYIGKYKDQKAYSYWKSNFVDAILHAKFGQKCFVKCKVTPSQSIREEPRDVWIAFEKDGKVICGWCTCIAGTSAACNHIIATLYKMEYACSQGFNDPACTSVPCEWNKTTRKDIAPSKIRDLCIRKDKRSTEMKPARNTGIISELWKNFDPRRDGQRLQCDRRVQKFIDTYQVENPNAVLFKCLERTNDYEILELRPLDEIANIFADANKGLSDENLISTFMEKICINAESVKRLEEKTRGQSENKNWHKQRKGRITASMFKDTFTKVNSILKSRGTSKTRPKTTPLVVKLLYPGKDLGNIPAIKWGRDHEDDALRQFHSRALVGHTNCKVTKCGLFVLNTKPYIGASPDGIMTCSCCGTSTLEIKCPFVIKDELISESYAKTEFLEKKEGQISLKKTHSYYYQTIGQMAVSGCEKGIFIVWTSKDLLVLPVQFDRSFWETMVANLDLFFKGYMLKVMLNIDTVVFCPTCTKPILESVELSEKEQDEESICCDHCGCWFHFRCVNVKRIQQNEDWLCQPCLITMTSDHDL